MCIAIDDFLGYDAINFEISIIFLIKQFLFLKDFQVSKIPSDLGGRFLWNQHSE